MTPAPQRSDHSETDELGGLLEHIRDTIGEDPSAWAAWPGGWPDDIEAALVDAVFSARAVYRTKHGRGIHHQVVTWMDARPRRTPSLHALSAEIDSMTPLGWAERFGNQQRSPRRPDDAPGGPTKAATVREAAGRLRCMGVDQAKDIDPANAHEVKAQLMAVPGVGYATANYFLMLLGRPGVKPDRMVHRFLKQATKRTYSNRDAESLITQAATTLDVQPHELEHAIWKYQSDQASAGGEAADQR